MKYLFYDLEKATSKNCGKICEFGYVVTDEKFNVLERNNFIINPSIEDKDWDWYAVKNVLKRNKSEYINCPDFEYYYPKIEELIESSDCVVGYSVTDDDAKTLIAECKRYGKSIISYDYIDIKPLYKYLIKSKDPIGLERILADLNVTVEDKFHDAGADAYNTLLAFRAVLDKFKLSIEDLSDGKYGAKFRVRDI